MSNGKQNMLTLTSGKDSVYIPMHFQRIGIIKGEIFIELMNNRKYKIKSKVSKETLESFIKYWQDGQMPEINSDNCWGYNQLSNEFGIMKEVSWEEYDLKLKISRLRSIGTDYENESADISSTEDTISQDLNTYLTECPNDLFSIRITSLYNIIRKGMQNVSDINQLYKMIVKNGKNNSDLYVLLSLFNTDNLSEEAVIDAALNIDERNDFSPQFTKSAIKLIIEYKGCPKKDLTSENYLIRQDLIDNEREYQRKLNELKEIIEEQKEEIRKLKNELTNARKVRTLPVRKPKKKKVTVKKTQFAKSQIIKHKKDKETTGSEIFDQSLNSTEIDDADE